MDATVRDARVLDQDGGRVHPRQARSPGVRRRLSWTLGCALAGLLVAGPATATHVGISSGVGQAGPITTASARILPPGSWGVEMNVEYLGFDTFSDERLGEFAAEDLEIHNVDHLLQYHVGVAYGLANGMSLHLRVPYVVKSDIRESEPPDEIHGHGDAHGIGDLAIHVHHRVWRNGEGRSELSLTYGLKIPTGTTDDTDDHGERFEAEFQPGSGSLDPFFGVECSMPFGKLSLDANLLYTVVNRGTQSSDLGDMFNYNFAVSYPWRASWGSFEAVLEINGLWKAKEEQNNEKDPDSGGSIVYISPGIRLGFGNSFGAFASLGFPVLQDLNGIQNEVDVRGLCGIVVTR